MMLYINGQDINEFILGLIDGEDSTVCKYEEADPGQFLKHLDDFLQNQNVSIDDIAQITVVVGPGSATALRSTLSIVNTIIFVKDIQVFGVEKVPEQNDEEVLEQILNEEVELKKPERFLKPVYAQGPRITISKKDALRRVK